MLSTSVFGAGILPCGTRLISNLPTKDNKRKGPTLRAGLLSITSEKSSMRSHGHSEEPDQIEAFLRPAPRAPSPDPIDTSPQASSEQANSFTNIFRRTKPIPEPRPKQTAPLLCLPTELLLQIHALLPAHAQVALRCTSAALFHLFFSASFERGSTHSRLNFTGRPVAEPGGDPRGTIDPITGWQRQRAAFAEAWKRDVYDLRVVAEEREWVSWWGGILAEKFGWSRDGACCSMCREVHARKMFTAEELAKDPGERVCLGWLGKVVFRSPVGGDESVAMRFDELETLQYARSGPTNDFKGIPTYDFVPWVPKRLRDGWDADASREFAIQEVALCTERRGDGYRAFYQRVLFRQAKCNKGWRDVLSGSPAVAAVEDGLYVCPHISLSSPKVVRSWEELLEKYASLGDASAEAEARLKSRLETAVAQSSGDHIKCDVKHCETYFWFGRVEKEESWQDEIYFCVDRKLGDKPTDVKWLAQLEAESISVREVIRRHVE